MPEVIQDKQFRKQYALRNVAKLVPLLVGLFFLVRGAAAWNVDTLIATVAFVIGTLHCRQLLRSYYCPSCQRHLPQPTRPVPNGTRAIRLCFTAATATLSGIQCCGSE